MAGSSFGTIFRITTWGESHGKGLGVVIDGCPSGIELCEEDIQRMLDRRRPGVSDYTTSRKESDKAVIMSGVFEGKTTGTPISIMVYNEDHHSEDYSDIANFYRPGHADYTFDCKYGFRDYRGGGRSSGRETVAAVYFVLKMFNLTNNHLGLIMVYSASSGLGYLIAKGFFDTVPRALCEAAKIDGCSESKIFFKMILPLSRPIIVYTVISSFLVPWMDFVYAKIILNAGISSKYTVAIGLYRMLDKSLINQYFTLFCAAGIVISIPISALFVLMQKFYVEGVTGGAVKG